ncbi:MAG: glucose-6-phosphate dehydrogenase [Deltaproteobacteria bacterium]|nr:glucose-6-phosphate dehydrogenase [Deltaproteobacteria bacterium]
MANEKNENSRDLNAFAETSTPDLEIPYDACILEGPPDPCALVIIGASGDLTSRKLVPALYNLFLRKTLPDPFLILGCGRTEMSDQSFRDRMKDSLLEIGGGDLGQWDSFAPMLHYQKVQYDDLSSYDALSQKLKELTQGQEMEGNLIFYLAIPPSLYKTTAQMIGKVGLSREGKDGGGWSRIVVEKPFGRDLNTAIELNRALQEFFEERQIFRIDHYLAKETVQNILMFRFANAIFEPLWNRRYIDYVNITASETLGVEYRAGYYEQAGVIRDMFQNHMMQVLALTAMEPPTLFEADRVREEKVKVYRSLRPFPVDALQDHLILGQYHPGTIDGRRVPAYREEPGVSDDSLTPTFAMMKVFVDNWRWQGVPFYLASGKRLAEKLTQITIQFKQVPHSMFRQTLGDTIKANRLVLGIYPEEKITLTFQTKNPGAVVCLRSVTMDFNYQQSYTGPLLDAYEKVLLDCMMGDQMLFLRQDGVELCWDFLTPIIEECETCGGMADMLHPYEAGGWGPPAIEAFPNKYYMQK